MKTTISVLFSDLRGSAGGVTAAAWKGRSYVRSKVKPANPNTAAQQSQRSAFRVTAKVFQLITAAVKNAWKSTAQAAQVSEFNSWMKANTADEKASALLTYTPVNASVQAPSNVAVVTGASIGGNIDITWDLGSADGSDDLAIWYRPLNAESLEYTEPAGATLADLTATLSGLDDTLTYSVAIAGKDAVDGYSLSQGGTAQPSSLV